MNQNKKLDQWYYDVAREWVNENYPELPEDKHDAKVEEAAQDIYALDHASEIEVDPLVNKLHSFIPIVGG
ncbi:MAG TPA: hypothetical protein VIE65_04170 [Methylobacter sp.]|jgi:hypothetical protein